MFIISGTFHMLTSFCSETHSVTQFIVLHVISRNMGNLTVLLRLLIHSANLYCLKFLSNKYGFHFAHACNSNALGMLLLCLCICMPVWMYDIKLLPPYLNRLQLHVPYSMCGLIPKLHREIHLPLVQVRENHGSSKL